MDNFIEELREWAEVSASDDARKIRKAADALEAKDHEIERLNAATVRQHELKLQLLKEAEADRNRIVELESVLSRVSCISDGCGCGADNIVNDFLHPIKVEEE